MKKMIFLALVAIISLTSCKTNREPVPEKIYETFDDFVGEYVVYSPTGEVLYDDETFLKVEKQDEGEYSFSFPKFFKQNKPYQDDIKALYGKMDLEILQRIEQNYLGIEAYNECLARLYESGFWGMGVELFKIKKGEKYKNKLENETIKEGVTPTRFYLKLNIAFFESLTSEYEYFLEKVK